MSRLFSKGALRHSTNAAISTHVPPGPLRTTTPTSKAAARVLRALASRDRPISSPASRRDIHHVGRFEPLRPPSPSSLGAPRAARTYVRGRRWGRRLLLLSAVLGAAYLTDRAVYASGLARTLRTLGTGLVVALDYKLNFRPDPLPWLGGAAGIPELHRRNAERLFALLHHNGGLYLKIGQAIAMQSAVLPPEFARMFARMFDDAPQDGWDKIERVIREDFDGRSVQEVFGVRFADSEGKADAEGTGVMETTARASASVAQVHYGKLPDGREIAVKIQKPDIAKQINWDLWAFKVVTRVYTWWFDLPLYGFVPFITERLRLETDFENEAKNSETMRDLINGEPSMRGRVYVPQVYREFSTKRVLTTEWIEGVRLRDKETLTRPWYGGHGKGSPGVRRQTLASPGADAANRGFPLDSNNRGSKSENPGWRGPRGKGGLGVSTKDVMTIMIDLFSAQIFKWGVVHCDPHPGNIFIRRLETGKPELVLIDHGLYVYMSEEFRREYSRFWKAMMTYDNKTLKEISTGWGINSVDLFASATLMRPYEGDKGELKNKILAATDGKTASERSYEMQRRMKQGIRSMLADETKWPQELIFIGRNMRIVQANNQSMGSPVNRIKMMGNWASRSMYEDRSLPLRERLRNAYRHLLFRGVLVLSDVAFYFFKLRAWLGIGRNMEDEVEARMKDVAKDFGVELQHDVFEG